MLDQNEPLAPSAKRRKRETQNSQKKGSFFLHLPLGLLGGLVGPLAGRLASAGSPVGGLASGGGSGGVPVARGSGSTGETSSGSLPVTTSGLLEARLDGGRALLVDAGELLLLDLVLGLGLRVAVCCNVSFEDA